MLTRAAALTAAALVAAAAVVVPAAPASAADGPCVNGCGGGGGGGGGANANSGNGSISVTVSGTGVSGDGQTFSVPPSTVRTQPVCWYDYVMSGKEYYDNWESGRYDQLMAHLPEEDHFEAWPGYTEYKDDEEGGWWSPRCSSEFWPGEWDGFFEFTSAYFDEHDAVYVEVGEVPPESDVPPEVLAEIAFEAMDLPAGTIAWNPTRDGDGATFVGLDTWVWVEGAATSVEVTATVSTGTWARVEAELDELVVDAANASAVSCVDAGIAWSESADPDAACRLVFDRSSANQRVKAGHSVPTATTTATATWTASWVSSLDSNPTALPSQEISATAEIPVAEIQSLVTR